MSTVTCPHCGFNNFSISAYCAQCERPLSAPPATQTPSPAPQRAAPRPPPKTGAPASTLPSASQVAQQILQTRPPVPAVPQAAPLPSAADVAAQLMQRRTQNDRSSEPTVVARTPVEAQRALVAERAPVSPKQPPLNTRPPLQPIHDDPTVAGSSTAPPPRAVQVEPSRHAVRAVAIDRRALDASEEPTGVFSTPTLLDMPAQQRAQTASAAASQAVPVRAAAPALPRPAAAREVVPVQREPAPRPASPRVAEPFPNPFRHAEGSVPGSVLRQGTAPPQRTASRPPATASLTYAEGWRVLLAHVVDLALLVGFFALFVNIDAAITGPRGLDAHGKIFEFLAAHPGSTLRTAVLTFLAATAYHVVLAQHGGRTVGRMLAGTELARRSGKPMNWFIVVVRTVASFVSLFAFGAGFFWAIVDPRGRGFHDLVAGTMVVRHHRG